VVWDQVTDGKFVVADIDSIDAEVK